MAKVEGVLHLLMDLNWVNFEFGVTPLCLAARLLLANMGDSKFMFTKLQTWVGLT